jgi:hypothetical protein
MPNKSPASTPVDCFSSTFFQQKSFQRLPAFVFSALARTFFLAHSFFMPTDEQTSPEQFAALRAMTGAR